ncbi:hypothetical protein ACLBX0_01375 [Methylobacterium brachiatum]|uniref:hypothetical protein n=1 Tax=Methylobacterium sp. 092160098-2 TaxID=3025129 RepID=UPI002381AF3D|nr:hypothetical protein [Methylobacterium sp. 092160098-2]MDE4914964.1 hypothetical protein [Methylobacterium sp. 092160098-2]
MNSAAERLPFSAAHAEHSGYGDPRGENVVAFAPFVDAQEAERVMAQGDPSDELHAFLRQSLGKLDRKLQASPPHAPIRQEPAVQAAEVHPGLRHVLGRGGGDLSPHHPAYEAARPVHFDQPLHLREPHREPEPAPPRLAPQPAPQQRFPFPPAPTRTGFVDDGAPTEDGTAFDMPSFLRARPGIPPVSASEPAAPEQASREQVAPVRVQAPQPEPAKLRRPNHTALRSVAGELIWLYSVFPATIVLQIVLGLVWGPLASFAACFAFVGYAAVWALLRPSLFQMRVSTGWQIVVAFAAFRALDVGSPEQWMHMFAVFAATAVVVVAMGGVEIQQRIKAR